MKTTVIGALLVIVFSTAHAQQKSANIEGKTTTETVVEAKSTEMQLNQSAEAKARADYAQQTLVSEVNHVKTVVASADVDSKGSMVSEVAISKALEVSPQADQINVGIEPNAIVKNTAMDTKVGMAVKTGTKVNTNVKVNPVNISTKVKVKTGLGLGL